jgi:hypothetical protein
MHCEERKTRRKPRRTTVSPIEETHTTISFELKPFNDIFSDSDRIGKPFDPYRWEEDNSDTNMIPIPTLNNTSIINVRYGYLRYGNGLGFVVTLSIVVSLISMCRMNRSSHRRVRYIETPQNDSSTINDQSKSCATAASNSGSNDAYYFDIESDPAPPYRDCVETNAEYSYFYG